LKVEGGERVKGEFESGGRGERGKGRRGEGEMFKAGRLGDFFYLFTFVLYLKMYLICIDYQMPALP